MYYDMSVSVLNINRRLLNDMTRMKKKILVAALAILMLQMLTKEEPAMAKSFNLSQFQWKNRLLFLFGPGSSEPALETLKKQIQMLPAEMADRDLVVFEIYQSGISRMDEAVLDASASQSLRQHFRVPDNGITIILVGKDGGVKLKRHHPVDLQDIFGLIDSMPMRQNEMQQKNNS